MNLRLLAAAAAVTASVVLPGARAFADTTDYTSTPANVQAIEQTRPQVAPAVSGNSALPVTGADLAGLTVLGLAGIGTGTVLVRKSRSRRVA